MEIKEIHNLYDGMIIYINSDVVTKSHFGSTSEMREMIGHFYPIKSVKPVEHGVSIFHKKCSMTFTFHINDIEFRPKFYAEDDIESFFVSEKTDITVDPSLFLD